MTPLRILQGREKDKEQYSPYVGVEPPPTFTVPFFHLTPCCQMLTESG